MPAAEHAWTIATSLMISIATSVIVIGVLFGIAGWLASPTESARASRRVIAPVLRDHAAYVYATLAVIVCVYFLLAPTQNLRSFLTTLVVAGLAAFGIRELRRQSHEEFPEAEMGNLFDDAKERVTDAVKSANLGERASKLRLPEMRRPGGEDGADDVAKAAPAASDEESRLRTLERLGELHAKGVLSDEEFAAEKARVLGNAP